MNKSLYQLSPILYTLYYLSFRHNISPKLIRDASSKTTDKYAYALELAFLSPKLTVSKFVSQALEHYWKNNSIQVSLTHASEVSYFVARFSSNKLVRFWAFLTHPFHFFTRF